MHPRIYREFEKICQQRKAGGVVLEIGAVPKASSLLTLQSLKNATAKIGINLEGPYEYEDFRIIRGNANSMPWFEDGKFDTVLCNATLEHDKFFWKTISEIRRVAKAGGLIVIGVPGYVEFALAKRIRSLFRKAPLCYRYANFLVSSTLTFFLHNAPGDYYRFSPQVFKEVFLEGMMDLDVRTIMLPPRLIGSAVKPA